MGTFAGAKRHVLHSFARLEPLMKKRACSGVHARRRVPRGATGSACAAEVALGDVRRARHRRHVAAAAQRASRRSSASHAVAPPLELSGAGGRAPEGDRDAADRGTSARASACCSISASATSRSGAARRRAVAGGLQRLRLATQVHSNLFSVVYVLHGPQPASIPSTPRRCCAALSPSILGQLALFVVPTRDR
jgi:excinuclease ABC subunit A